MKLSTKVRYGLRAMIELAICSKDKTPVLVQTIADNQEISKKYLENLLASLKSAGLVRSVRGAKGGYILARPTTEISVADIVLAFDNSLAVSECVEKPEICSRVKDCSTHDLWVETSNAIINSLKRVSLAEMAEKEKNKKSNLDMYYI